MSVSRKNLIPKGDQILAIVLGAQTTKAVLVQRKGDRLCLLNYLLQEAPAGESGYSRDLLAKHFTNIKQNLGAKTDRTILVIGMGDSLIRHAELPVVDTSVMRKLLKINSNSYFQQHLPDFEFDCHILAERPSKHPAETPGPHLKNWVLVGGAKSQLLEDLDQAAKSAKLDVVQITLTQVSLVNAATCALPDLSSKEAVALVDIGYAASTITLLLHGTPELNRVVGIGGDKFTSGLSESMGITYALAEGIKRVMPDKVQSKLQKFIAPLGQELRAAIDFFETQQDKKVSQIFVSGGSARSDLILQVLQEQMAVACQKWDPTTFLQTELPPEKAQNLPNESPQLAAAIGAAATWFKPDLIQINLLADKLEAEESRRRDPFRRCVLAACLLVVLMGLWIIQLYPDSWGAQSELNQTEYDLKRVKFEAQGILAVSRKTAAIEANLQVLHQQAAQRFLWAAPLNALQFATTDGIQFLQLRLQENLAILPEKTNGVRQGITLTIRAKDASDPPASDQFMDALARDPYFQEALRKENPVTLKERLPPQIDPTNPSKSFVLFTILCAYPERSF
jgi:type IV pilus assembly protein PilM